MGGVVIIAAGMMSYLILYVLMIESILSKLKSIKINEDGRTQFSVKWT